MIKRIELVVIMLIITANLACVYGQEIFGKVSDSNGTPIEFANVLLLTQRDSVFVTGNTTDSDGSFTFKSVENNNGPYILKVSALGYENTCVRYHGSPCEITLKNLDVRLQEIVVTGRRRVFRQTSKGFKTLIADSPLSNLTSIGEVFNCIPGLFKTSDGSYRVIGKGTPVFYINGHRVYDQSEIDNLSPNMVKAVEIVRNPGVSYGANIKSVVKITTIRKPGEGFGMNLRSSYYYWTNSDCIERVNWNYRKDNLDIFASHSYEGYNSEVKSDLAQSLYVDPNLTRRQEYYQKSLSSSRTFNNMLGLNYIINEKNNIGVKYNLNVPLNTTDKGFLDSKIYENKDIYDELTSNNISRNEAPASHHVNAYYRGKSGNLSFGTDMDFLKNKHSYFNTYSEKSTNFENRDVKTDGTVSNTLFASKVFSELNLSKWSFVLGVDYSWTNRKNDYNSKKYIDSENDNIHETHLSPYIDITHNIGNCQIMGGLRYENAWTKYLSNDDCSRKNYSNIYPNISVYLPVNNIAFLASYSIKDRKPSYSMLRNEVTYGNRFTYQTGNPFLKSERIHNIDLSLASDWFQLAFNYADRRNAILYSSSLYKDDTSISLISFSNIPSLKNITASLSVAPSVGIWDPTLTLAVTRQWFTSESDYENIKMNKPIFITDFSNMFDFGKGWRAYLNMNYTSKGDNENCKLSRSTYCLDLGLYKSLLNNNLTLSVGVTDLFDSQKSGNILHLNNLNTTQVEWNDSREVSVSVVYNFNSARKRYKGRNAGEEEQRRM